MEHLQQDSQSNNHYSSSVHLKEDEKASIEDCKNEFFNNVEKLFSFFLELNSELNNLYGVCFVNPSILSLGNSLIKQTLKSDKLLSLFAEHFNHFGNYDKFIAKDVDFYKECLLNEIADTDIIPSFYKTIFKQNINKVFDEGYIEEDHVDNFYEYSKEIIKCGILCSSEASGGETTFTLKDERWKEILS